MKLGLKIGAVMAPIPFAFAVCKGPHALWVKVISVLWAVITGCLYLGMYISNELLGNAISMAIFFSISGLINFFILSGILSLIKKGMLSVKKSIKEQAATQQKPTNNTEKVRPHVADDEPLTQRRMKALYKLANQILEDEVVDLAESKKLMAWFNRYPESKEDPRTQKLAIVVKEYLSDKALDHDEALHLFSMLTDFCDDFEQQEKELQKNKITIPSSAKQINIAKGSGFSFLNDLTLGNIYFMSYRDASGNISNRNIILKRVDSNDYGDTYINAYCLMRNALRTFRADRITGLCCVETGEEFF
ncbi:hypothetical protein ACOMICROBIO_GDFFDHBD_02492 [Vibrio sp. B1REV9]|uniref:WYL domain-containing protein n=1 Tax=Vibrio sp. B1REV9 TaxID=2751179 RepID=UPI001AF5B54C|nr:hypothetical protein [Vibrio sp. B1REV9]CAE6929290.1 hypothetical protein ACOMICROBIO_GDFFDHBD_02492 [Vibrio sp. B1REV9]